MIVGILHQTPEIKFRYYLSAWPLRSLLRISQIPLAMKDQLNQTSKNLFKGTGIDSAEVNNMFTKHNQVLPIARLFPGLNSPSYIFNLFPLISFSDTYQEMYIPLLLHQPYFCYRAAPAGAVAVCIDGPFEG